MGVLARFLGIGGKRPQENLNGPAPEVEKVKSAPIFNPHFIWGLNESDIMKRYFNGMAAHFWRNHEANPLRDRTPEYLRAKMENQLRYFEKAVDLGNYQLAENALHEVTSIFMIYSHLYKVREEEKKNRRAL